MKGTAPNSPSSLSLLRKRLFGLPIASDTKLVCSDQSGPAEGAIKRSIPTSGSRQQRLGANNFKAPESYYYPNFHPFAKRGSVPGSPASGQRPDSSQDILRPDTGYSRKMHPLSNSARERLLGLSRSPHAHKKFTVPAVTPSTFETIEVLKQERPRNRPVDSTQLKSRVSTKLLFGSRVDSSAVCLDRASVSPHKPEIQDRRTSLNQIQAINPQSHLATPIKQADRKPASPGWKDFNSAVDRMKQTRQRLQNCLRSLRGEKQQEPKEAERAGQVPPSFKSAFIETPKSLSNEELTSSGLAADDGQLSQSAGLKHLLLSPASQGMQMSLGEFRQLEESSTNTRSPSKKGCLKLQSQLIEGTSSQDLPQKTPQQLKRGVSFSENVVMFIYQA